MLHANSLSCWCGESDLRYFSDSYLLCNHCKTLISTFRKSENYYKGSDDAEALYGREYWTRHVKETYGFPDIYERARNDLAERDIYWLNAILKHKLPPAKSFELGCAHGGSVFLMQMAGFNAEGSEMSPWLCEFANDTFGIPMHCGTIEDSSFENESLDCIIMMDVLEHMPNPVQSLQKIHGLLKEDGILVIQAPWWRSTEKTYEDMKRDDELFLLHLKEQEHLYLYSENSINKLLIQVGFSDIIFEKAIFPHDMFVFASKSKISYHSDSEIVSKLSENCNGRIVLALLDVYNNFVELNTKNLALNIKCNELEKQINNMQLLMVDDIENKLSVDNQIILKYENSLSWKITRPLRYVHSKLFK